MEAFKVVERETKTKAYSKEGLARDQPMTAEERKRMRVREWLTETAQRLSDAVDELEAEAEAAEETGGRSKKERDALAALEKVIRTHRWHVDKLEAVRTAPGLQQMRCSSGRRECVLWREPRVVCTPIPPRFNLNVTPTRAQLARLVDNAAVDVDEVDGLKDDVEFYIEQVRVYGRAYVDWGASPMQCPMCPACESL